MPSRTVEMVNGLPVVHYDREERPTPQATWRCPTGAIQWLEGGQFTEADEDEVPAGRVYG
jgi:hypothetical protein